MYNNGLLFICLKPVVYFKLRQLGSWANWSTCGKSPDHPQAENLACLSCGPSRTQAHRSEESIDYEPVFLTNQLQRLLMFWSHQQGQIPCPPGPSNKILESDTYLSVLGCSLTCECCQAHFGQRNMAPQEDSTCRTEK